MCESFGRLGYCEKGLQCVERHVFECPDYTNKGVCTTPGCRLPHLKHAGRWRKTLDEAAKDKKEEKKNEKKRKADAKANGRAKERGSGGRANGSANDEDMVLELTDTADEDSDDSQDLDYSPNKRAIFGHDESPGNHGNTSGDDQVKEQLDFRSESVV